VSTPSASANEPTDGSYDKLVSAAQSEGCADGLGGGGGEDKAGEGVMSTSDSVMLVTVETLGIVAEEDGINSSTTEDATDSGSGTSSGCTEQISVIVYPDEGSLGQMSAVSYSEPISAVPYSGSDGIAGSDSYVVVDVLAVR
jgi:hypothetical protein